MRKDNSKIMQDIRTRPLAYTVQAVTVLVLILNLWIASKLSPLAKDLAVVVEKVESMEQVIVPRNEIELQLKEINRRLTNIEEALGGR